MIENFPVKIDNVGRVVIPKKIRTNYGINKNEKLCIKEINDELVFLVIKDTEKIINKIKRIEKLYPKIKIILKNKKEILYNSKSCKNISNFTSFSKTVIKNELNDDLNLLIEYKNDSEKFLSDTICKLIA